VKKAQTREERLARALACRKQLKAEAMYKLLREYVGSGVEFDDERIGYKMVQVPRELDAQALALLVEIDGEEGE
jgi:hypothetical protein